MVFGKEDISKNLFYKSKQSISTDKIDTQKTVLSRKESHGKKDKIKYFIGYISNVGIIPLYIKLSQMNGYVKYFNDNKCMNL